METIKKIAAGLLITFLTSAMTWAQDPKDSLKRVFSLNDYTII